MRGHSIANLFEFLQEMNLHRYFVMYVGKSPPKFAHNVSMRARDGFVISVVVNMSAAKICSCRWLILHGLECVDIQDRNIVGVLWRYKNLETSAVTFWSSDALLLMDRINNRS